MPLDFAGRAPTLELTDPLGELLGALAPGETLRYTYADAVKLCGHSCPTVAGAYVMTAAALDALYPGGTPVRGDLEVTVGGEADDGHSGPIAQVIGLITGAAPDTGFGGLMGRHRRRHLLRFDPALAGRVRFRRTDDGTAVEVTYTPDRIPPHPEMGGALAAALSGRGGRAERERFGRLFQERVAAILADRSRVVAVVRLP